ncbi:putative toxin [Vibrio splendidus]
MYEFTDTAGKKYVGQSVNMPNRLKQHVKTGKLDPNQSVKTTEVLGGKTAREIAEHKRIQEITGGVPARFSDKVSKRVTPNQIGQAGEAAVQAAFDIGKKQKFSINGRVRIPDGVTSTTLSEVKNVKSLSYTKQLRDFADIAKQQGLQYDLYVRPSTKLSGPLTQAIQDGPINLKVIPGAK